MKKALISVSDKTNLVPFAQALIENGYEIISTGGTRNFLKQVGVQTTDIQEVTHFPEILDGRVKTLHPNVHAGLLAKRDHADHMQTLADHGIDPIDLVCVNLYPFKETILKDQDDFEGAIEGEADFSLDSSECFCDNFSLKIFIKSEKMPNSEELRNILNKLIEPNELEKIEINVQKNQNWQKKWMDNWEPFYLTNNIVVCPSWKDFASKKNEIIIKLDPANAFGTGVHATTKLCSQKICEIIDKNTRMIDIGTGSGILSIVASAFNASLIFAIDNDINVIKTAKENFDKNKFCSNSNIRLEFGTCYEFQSMKFNLIVANLLHHIIARDVHVYKKMLEENGKMILSGILKEKLPIVEEAIDKENLTIVSRDILDNWVCLVVEKNRFCGK